MLKGIGVSAGIGIAQAVLWSPPLDYSSIPRSAHSSQLEAERFEKALTSTIIINNQLLDETARRIGDSEAAIFGVYYAMLTDDEILSPIRNLIEKQQFSAEYAVLTCFNNAAKKMHSLQNEYLRQRADDFHDLRDQLLRELMGVEHSGGAPLQQPTIVVAHNLAPGDITRMDRSRLAGLVCETGGYTSHTYIIARNLGIPAVIGVPFAEMVGTAGRLLALDGESGEIWVDPNPAEIGMLRARSHSITEQRKATQQYFGVPAVTLDGRRVELSSNVGQLPELEASLEADAEFVGLFRTELIQPEQPGMANEEEQFALFKKAIEMLNGKALTIRTLDIGDHRIAPLGPLHTGNPALGFRGIRMSLGRPSMLRAQLRAILRASAYGSVKIIFPMVSTLRELDEAVFAVGNVKDELRRENLPFDEAIQLGILVEIPSTALMAPAFARKVDFFSIGLNDLVQFTLAADRGTPQIASLFNPCHPAVLQLVDKTIQGAHSKGIPCSICVDFPNQNQALPLFLGLGADGFSLSPRSVLPARQAINYTSFSYAKKLAQKAMEQDSAEAVLTLL